MPMLRADAHSVGSLLDVVVFKLCFERTPFSVVSMHTAYLSFKISSSKEGLSKQR